jgi:hypothetical protein
MASGADSRTSGAKALFESMLDRSGKPLRHPNTEFVRRQCSRESREATPLPVVLCAFRLSSGSVFCNFPRPQEIQIESQENTSVRRILFLHFDFSVRANAIG